MRLVIADDHRIVREGLRLILSHDTDIEIVGEAEDGEQLLTLLQTAKPDVVLLDLRMPGMSGLEVLDRLRELEETVRVIALTMHDDPAYVRRTIERGACGYLLKSVGAPELLRAVHAVAEGKNYIHGEVTGPLVEQMMGVRSGRRVSDIGLDEIQIIEMLADGMDNREVAQHLDVTEAAVKARLRSIYATLGVKRRSEAVATALRLGIIS
ncbi:MAG: response regulator [Acidimicrobiia bacterium]